MKYSIVIGSDCVAILINGSLDFVCPKEHFLIIFVEYMELLDSMGYSLDKVEYNIDFAIYE